MKKILFLLIIIPCFVFADVFMPDEYNVKVINPDGAYIYNKIGSEFIATEEKIDYGTNIYVYEDYTYRYFHYYGSENCSRYGCFIDKNDLEIIKKISNEPYRPVDNRLDILKIGIVAAVIISITAVVTILLVNKKKGSKINE